MERIKIIADEHIPFLRGALEPFARVEYLPAADIKNTVLNDAEALIIRTRTQCNSNLLQGSRVRFIASATIGHDHIDKEFCTEQGITWTNAPGCNASSVQQYVLAALLQMAEDHHVELSDKTLGIIGVGNVGSRIERVARLLGMNVLLNDPPRAESEGESGFTGLAEVLRQSDIVSLHVPLNKGGKYNTFHMADEAFFEAIKPGAWLINTARGEVVDTEALKVALKTGKLAGSVIDVWENEPNIDRELLRLSHLSTPHTAGYSTDGKANGTAMTVNAVAAFFGWPLAGWYPAALPQPANPVISIDCSGLTDQQVLHSIVKSTYNIASESQQLKSDPSSFETMRNHYPIRREFGAYEICLKGSNKELVNRLIRLDFTITLIGNQ